MIAGKVIGGRNLKNWTNFIVFTKATIFAIRWGRTWLPETKLRRKIEK
jgi:hypothetical protein